MSSLEAKQEERKKRLSQLKSAAAGGAQKRPNDGEEREEMEKPLRFRSYKPESTELKGFVDEAPAIGPEATEKGMDTVESRVAQIEENVLEEERQKNPELVGGSKQRGPFAKIIHS
jgi:hypothetical protein